MTDFVGIDNRSDTNKAVEKSGQEKGITFWNGDTPVMLKSLVS